ncbi:MAG: coenzyme F420-0:L-glutamate ligase [Clostridiaceae bacterium]|nr:coenzyme F420-0:L-glutamate ligase [Clostridiaceae bacterium]
MDRTVGTVVRGIRAPIIREGDDLAGIVVESLLAASDAEGFAPRDRDVIAITEAVAARAQGNYADVEQIAADVRAKFGRSATVGVLFPILSRNRFAIVLRGIAMGARRVILQLSYPSDEVGNHLVSEDTLDALGLDPWRDVLTDRRFYELFGKSEHPFTGMDYIAYYREVIEAAGAKCEILLANRPEAILGYTENILCCDIHTRARTARKLRAAGAARIYTLADILSESVDGSGYNPDYGLYGSNKATETRVKLFPREMDAFVAEVASRLLEKTGKHIEVMIYGDGAFKDPVGKIWELADPVVSPAYTAGLGGTPNELKLKYLADNDFAALSGDALRDAIRESIRKKDANLHGQMASQGTTPRRLTDLIGSLCDLCSGSGDKGTPFVYIQGYFDNYTN